MFLIGPFFAGIGYQLYQPAPDLSQSNRMGGLAQLQRLLKSSRARCRTSGRPTDRPARGGRRRHPEYPRSRDYTRDEAALPPVCRDARVVQRSTWPTHCYYVLAGDPDFPASIFNVIFFALVVIPLQTGLGLLLALLVNQKLRGRNFFRTIYFSPVVTSMVVVSIVWTFLYDKDNGLINQFLRVARRYPAVNWLGNPTRPCRRSSSCRSGRAWACRWCSSWPACRASRNICTRLPASTAPTPGKSFRNVTVPGAAQHVRVYHHHHHHRRLPVVHPGLCDDQRRPQRCDDHRGLPHGAQRVPRAGHCHGRSHRRDLLPLHPWLFPWCSVMFSATRRLDQP